jgi:hypothetical protein
MLVNMGLLLMVAAAVAAVAGVARSAGTASAACQLIGVLVAAQRALPART